jgi:hypothetical protein
MHFAHAATEPSHPDVEGNQLIPVGASWSLSGEATDKCWSAKINRIPGASMLFYGSAVEARPSGTVITETFKPWFRSELFIPVIRVRP